MAGHLPDIPQATASPLWLSTQTEETPEREEDVMGILGHFSGKLPTRREERIHRDRAPGADERRSAIETENARRRLEALYAPRIWL